jgi:hypothetical protein
MMMPIALLALAGLFSDSRTSGPLRVCTENPRYFADAAGRAVYLTGSHTWGNLKDIDVNDPPKPFDFDAYLRFFEEYNHNFIRLWTWELSKYRYSKDGPFLYSEPFPWVRTGPGNALDGKPKFDLKRMDETYFQRLRERVVLAGQRGIYVSVMLFEGHGVQYSEPPWCWDGHPFNAANNVNGVDGNPDGDERGTEVHTLATPAITAIQEAYVRRVVETLNDLDNVLYEVANEAGPYSTEWQYHIIRFVQSVEATLPKRHPVGMTFQYGGGSNRTLLESPADWISPNPDGGYRDNPSPADGSKVILNDTDHLWGIGGSTVWVWKSFLSGTNPLYMDAFDTQGFRSNESVRRSLGDTKRFAERVDLAATTPQPALASSGYCLSNIPSPNPVAIVWVPAEAEITVNLSGTNREVRVEWFHVADRSTISGETVTGGSPRAFRSPFHGDAVLFLSTGER